MIEGKIFKLIVFNIEKPQNVGMLIRSAYAFGCSELLVVGRQKFKQTGSAGSDRFLKRRHFYRLEDAVAECRDQGLHIYGLEIGGRDLRETNFDRDAAFVLGNEGRGLADARRFCDTIITIPQWGGVHSLNVAVAGGILMFEFQRHQGRATAPVQGERYCDVHFS